jgi:hypothetical protein
LPPRWWCGRCDDAVAEFSAHRAAQSSRLVRAEFLKTDAFAAVIRCTADPAKADKRTRSKWSRVMRYAAAYKPDSEAFGQCVQRRGGINACAALFTRSMGRGT